MSDQIIGMQDWFQTPVGRYVLGWEQSHLDTAVVDIFGYHAVQLGVPKLHALRANRMPHQWLAMEHNPSQPEESQQATNVVCDFAALPFPAASLDLMVLPHTLELSRDPHASLREAERVLVPDGKLVLTGFNMLSLWGLQQGRSRLYRKLGLEHHFLPEEGEFIAYWRLRDWLRLLGFEVDAVQFGCYRPGVDSAAWLERWQWIDPVGARWWPILGGMYFVVAVKRVRGMRLMGTTWKTQPSGVGAPVGAARHAVTDQTEETSVWKV